VALIEEGLALALSQCILSDLVVDGPREKELTSQITGQWRISTLNNMYTL
jgi:hypothetical protein